MQTTFEKLTSSKDFKAGIQFDAINSAAHNVSKAEISLFSHSLNIAKLYGKANEYLVSKQGKDELKRLNVSGTKLEILHAIFGKAESITKLYIQCSKISPDIVEQFKTSGHPQSLKNLAKFSGLTAEEREEKINTTATAPAERSAKEKPAKYTTGGKGIDIKINSGVTAQDVADAIAYLQSLDIK